MVHGRRGGGGNEGKKKAGREDLNVSLEQSRGVERRGNNSVVAQKMCVVRLKLRLSFDMKLKLLSSFSAEILLERLCWRQLASRLGGNL